MNSIEYWEKRKAKRMFEYMGLSEDAALEIAKLYRKASMYTTQEMTQIFNRYKTKFGLSEAEARRILNTLKDPNSLDELRKVLRNKELTAERKEALELLEAPAYRARINRLQDLQNNIDYMMQNIYQQEKNFNTKHYINLADEAYYKSIFDIQKSIGFGFRFSGLNVKDFDRLLGSTWSGSNYSDIIWKNTKGLAETLKKELIVSLITGRTENETASIIANKFDVAAYKARRLIRTESAFVAEEMEAKSYEECGAEKYRFLAVLDLKTSEICRAKDNQVFELSKRKTGVNYPPMHPWCRSTTCIYIDDETLEHMTRIARDPITGKNIKVPANMSYKEWYEKYVESNPQAKIIEKMYKNKSSDKKQYHKYKTLLGSENVPKSFEDFQEMKYNDIEKWKSIKSDYRVVNQYQQHTDNQMKSSKILQLHQQAYSTKGNMFTSKFKKSGNIGIMELDGEIHYAHSAANYINDPAYLKFKGNKNDLVLKPKNQTFVTKVIGTHDRNVDSEYKLFEYASTIVNDGKTHELNMLSEIASCESCKNVLKQFVERYPNVKVAMVSTKDERMKRKYEDNAKEGYRNVWKE